MKQISLFAGIEGFGLAGSWLGWGLVASVEMDKKCQQVIKKNFPNTEIHGKIEEFEAKKYRGAIDIITGGFPCQTFSLAGKGAMDLSLWKEMYRTICEVGPRWVVAENVPGLVSRKGGVALETVCADLEKEGFTVFPPLIIPACAVGAPHRRDRVWIVAYCNYKGIRRRQQQQKGKQKTGNITTNSNHTPAEHTIPAGGEMLTGILQSNAADCNGKRLQECNTTAITGKKGFDYRNVIEKWNEWTIEPTIHRVDDGLSSDVEQIKQYGNAIVPAVFYQIGKAINEFEILTNSIQ